MELRGYSMSSPLMNTLGLDKLSALERLNLVHDLWDSLVQNAPPSLLSDFQRQELARRSSDDTANPKDVISWEELKAKLLPGN